MFIQAVSDRGALIMEGPGRLDSISTFILFTFTMSFCQVVFLRAKHQKASLRGVVFASKESGAKP